MSRRSRRSSNDTAKVISLSAQRHSGESFRQMKSSMANLCVSGAGVAVLAISLATAVEEDDVSLLKRAQELFQPLPKDMATPESPITKERVKLGQQLFFDPRLTVDSNMSCASCHQPALYGTDALPTSIGVKHRLHPRNAPQNLYSPL